MTVGERIKKVREYCDISQVDLAKRIGVSKQSLYKYETNVVTNIPSNVIEQIANILDVSPCYLMGWEGKQYAKKESPKIMHYYELLNDIGKNAATEQVRLLTLDEKYTRTDNIIQLKEHSEEETGNAAHRRTDLPESELTPDLQQEDEDIMKNF